MPNALDNALLRRSLGISCLLAVITFLTFDLTELDRAISDLFYNPASQSFVLEHDRLFERVTHQWARMIPGLFTSLALATAMLAGVAALLELRGAQALRSLAQRARILPLLALAHRHVRDALFFLVAFALSATAVHYLKSHTSVYCPVETTLYGGSQAHVRWFENFNAFSKPGAGRCWPGGHASGAFSLMALYFIALRYQWRHARQVLWLTLGLGLLFGTTRVLQGWHYMSHTFWAGLIVWWCTAFTAWAFYARTARRNASEAHGLHEPVR
ncbi:phosphatase PAP2 family protein [Pseudomonas sp. DTU_2021_1001937_2_SI_NGA_ILE_001]|uniref:phosphatase PAP2 family protein n=1 Tax=Pseudomonas sp. DTU_2021_1001937_2_SI_NGA_ILE_001 TaxID=3077589 RepID=UPI0028FC14B7|nr:phosphatase PAP2 family protein [Pseudomonas sp. DTU_2021_1001937_2_SI_NGA_ILE_001]WNW12958.1 phosphatase PAP2 family protein [Pseudomonas sp. DTU_2021_1001937_2_SI_NGA_ILE_001]